MDLRILYFFLILYGCLVGCSSKLIIQSDPQDAEVSLSVLGKAEKAKVGRTPVELGESQINQLLQVGPERAALLEITLEKKDFETKTIVVPSNRWGELSKTVKLKMQPRTEASDTVHLLVTHLFNGKKFAESRQYEMALQELDKALSLDSRMAQAMVMKGGVFYLQGNFEQAEVWYKKALDVEPTHAEAIQMLERLQSKKASKN